MPAKLYFRYSSMNAGKTLDLLKVSYNYKERNKRALIFRPKIDTRSANDCVESRTGLKELAITFDTTDDLYKYVTAYLMSSDWELDCVLVDEAQFLTKEQVIQLTDIVDKYDIPVICYGLRTDYRGEPFEGSIYLLALADTLEEIKTICHCGRKATMNLRLVDGKPVYEGEQIIIGGNDMYSAVCRKHFKEGIPA